MKDLFGHPIPESVRGILYLCDYVYPVLKPFKALHYDNPEDALYAYGEIPNPPSQVAVGKTRESFLEELKSLHERMKSVKFQEELVEVL